MAQGVCWVARELGAPATVVAPDHAPRAKLDAVEREKLDLYQQHYADYVRIAKALQALSAT